MALRRPGIRDYLYDLVHMVGLRFTPQASDPLSGALDKPRLYYNSTDDTFNAVDGSGNEYQLARLGSAVPIPVVLSKHANGSVAARFTPGRKGKLRKITASVVDPATTAAKAATFTPYIGGVAVTGGALALTSANCGVVGAKVDGSAITGLNTFGVADEITLVASGVTAFVEGQVLAYLFVDPAA